MKALIGLACLVVIGGGAYFGVTEYTSRQTDKDSAQEAAIISGCQSALLRKNSSDKIVSESCLRTGRITQKEFDAAWN